MSSQRTNVLALALDARAQSPPDDAISERILDATLQLCAASGMRNLTMDDVATRAGVGRMTVYRRFGQKSALTDALAVREARQALAELSAAIAADRPIADQIAEGFVTALRIAREHPLLNRLARLEPASVLTALTDNDSALFAMGRAFVAERLREAQRAGTLGQLGVDVDQAAELFVRLGFSFVLIQDSVLALDDEQEARAIVRRMIAPLLGPASAIP